VTDRELLEAAAKAAGMEPFTAWGQTFVNGNGAPGGLRWNPLDDDGDALRLAVTLGIGTRHHVKWSQVFSPQTGVDDFNHDGDPYAATRRAIVRAAAAMAGQG
jgi:hypothetical protein